MNPAENPIRRHDAASLLGYRSRKGNKAENCTGVYARQHKQRVLLGQVFELLGLLGLGVGNNALAAGDARFAVLRCA